MGDQHLAVATGARADADGRHLDGRGDLACEVGRHRLDDDGEYPRGFERPRVVQQLGGVALYREAAKAMDRLRRQPDVPHDGDVGGDDGGDGGGGPLAPLELDRVGSSLFHEPSRVLHGLLRTHLVAHERHIGDDQRPPGAARHQSRVVDHFVHGHAKRGRLALDHHAERIADEQGIDPRTIEQAGHRPVIRGQHRQGRPAPFCRTKRRHGHGFRGLVHGPIAGGIDRRGRGNHRKLR